MFFLSLLRDNQPIRRLIDADYTFVNEELASTLYRMKDVQGTGMRRVPVTDPNRGGILGQGSILAVTSNYNQTSPVKRGSGFSTPCLARLHPAAGQCRCV